MNRKKATLEKLRQYELVRHSLKILPMEIAQLEQESVSLQSGMAMGSGSRNIRSREQKILRNLKRREELEAALDCSTEWMKTMNYALGKLELPERQVLYRMVIRPAEGAVDKLCEELEVEKSSVYRRRDRALEKLAVILYGPGKSK